MTPCGSRYGQMPQTAAARCPGEQASADNDSLPRTPGTGKTHLATGLAIRACQAGHRVLFATAAQWVARLAEAHHAGRLQAELVRLGRYPLLVIDEVGYIPFEPEAANLFFQLVSARLVHHAEVIALKGDSYRLKNRDLGRVPTAGTTTD
jgi:DNA replication protein DnaC